MNNRRFIIFFTTVMGLYACLHVYAGMRGWHYIPQNRWIQTGYIALVLLLFLSYPLGRFLERYRPGLLSETMVKGGAFWMAAIVYLFIGLMFTQIFGFVFTSWSVLADALVPVLTLSALVWGNWNATHSKVTRLKLRLAKKVPSLPPDGLRVVVISDIHMGTIVNRSRVKKMVAEINLLNPDVVLFPGDMLDEDLQPVIKGNLGEFFPLIRSQFGVYASTGNHEYIGGVDRGTEYLRDHGIRVLRDESVLIAGAFYLVGREDATALRFGGQAGKPLAELLEGLDRSKPIILLDHSPVRLAEAEKEGIDLSLSGHTHHGQFWPWNYVTTSIYELSRGYRKKGGTHVIVSNGYGTWGPPVRLGSRSEIVLIKLRSA